MTALSVEFVAKPQIALKAQSAIPQAIAAALQDVTGFQGCLVMASDQEMRLLTVITLWTGNDRFKRSGDHARWVHKLLTPYLDRRLRVQTLTTCLRLPLRIHQEREDGQKYSDLEVLTLDEERFAWRG
jgi:hypothetical protein